MTYAGNGTEGYSGDNGPAVDAALDGPRALAVAPDGSLFIADLANRRIRRVDPNGVITTVAGNGICKYNPNSTIPTTRATDVSLCGPFGVAVGSDGSVYFSETTRVGRVGTDGLATTVAGYGFDQGSTLPYDGRRATDQNLLSSGRLAVGPDGSVFVEVQVQGSVRRIAPDGVFWTTAGGGKGSDLDLGEGRPATFSWINPLGIAVDPSGRLHLSDGFRVLRVGHDGILTKQGGRAYKEGDCAYEGDGHPGPGANLCSVVDLAFGANGDLYISVLYLHRVVVLRSGLPRIVNGEFVIPSDHAQEAFVFDSTGRHLRTIDSATGTVRYMFSHDEHGRLRSITDSNGNLTTIERSTGTGVATAIVAPLGQRTPLELDSNGWLKNVTDPTGSTQTMESSSTGLLARFSDPNGQVHSFTYDELGRLLQDENGAGSKTTLVRTEQDAGYTVTTSTALGRTHAYSVESYVDSGTISRADRCDQWEIWSDWTSVSGA